MTTTIEDFMVALNAKYPNRPRVFTTGKRYWKICDARDGRGVSAYAFVDKATGNLYKPASWAAPAIHERGNINDPSGLEACQEYSVKYLN